MFISVLARQCHLSVLFQLLSDDANFGVYSLSTYDFSQYLHLDSAAVQALNVEAQAGDSPTCHLYGILNNCRSPQGQRLLQHWLRQPLLDKNRIGVIVGLVQWQSGPCVVFGCNVLGHMLHCFFHCRRATGFSGGSSQ